MLRPLKYQQLYPDLQDFKPDVQDQLNSRYKHEHVEHVAYRERTPAYILSVFISKTY